MAALPAPSQEPAGPPRTPWLRTAVDAAEPQPGRGQDRVAADVMAAVCAVVLTALALVTLPSFLAMHGPWVGESAALVTGAAFGYLSAGAHPMSRQGRWYLILGIWAAVGAAFGVAFWRDPAVRTLSSTWVSDVFYLVRAWAAGSTPPVPDLAGWVILFVLAWAIGAFVWRCLRVRQPLPAVAGVVGLLVFEWEFLDDAAGRAFWVAAAAGLLWLAAGWARELAERPWVGRPPAAFRIVGLAAAGIALLVGVVALLPLNRPAVDLGAMGYWIDTTFPTLAHMEQGTRLTPAAGPGSGPARNPGPLGPLSPASPYTMKMVGFSSNDGELGGPLATSDKPALQVTVVAGSAPSVLYLRGAADDTYTGRGWTESKESLYPSAPPRATAAPVFGVNNPLPPRDAYTLRVQPVGVVTSSLFTALTPVSIQGASPVWDQLANAWLANPMAPSASYEVSAVGVVTPTTADVASGAPEATQIAAGSLHASQAEQAQQAQAAALGPCFGCQSGQFGPSANGVGGRFARASFAADLQLPPTLPTEVRQLAQTWTQGDTTPLAEALDLQSHLLQIPYNMNAPAAAAGTDFVDQFLFHIQQGYCTYYASAMAVMLRSLNVPARWVTGFRVRTPQSGKEVTVTDAQAHAWVEAFIAPYGWLVFDPTPWGPTLAPVAAGGVSGVAGGDLSAPGDQAPTAVDLLRGPLAELLGVDPSAGGTVNIPRSLAVIPLAALLAVAAAFAWGLNRDRWNPADPLGSAERLWDSVERVAARQGRPRTGAMTPAEFAAALQGRWPSLEGRATTLADAYGSLRWGPPALRVGAALRVREAWTEINRIWTSEAPVRYRLRRLL